MSITPGQVGGKVFNAASTTLATGSNVTAGRTLIVKVTSYNSAGATQTPIVSRQGAGSTGNISASITDADLNNAMDSKSRLTILRFLVTVSGSLTLDFSCPSATNCTCSYVEVQSTLPLEVQSLPPSQSGAASPETSGSISLPRPGLIETVASELSSGNFTYTPSDTVEFSDGNGSTNATGMMQYKNAASPGTYAVTAAMSTSQTWACLAVVYQETQKGAYTDQPRRDMPLQQRRV